MTGHDPMVEPAWLAERLDAPDLVVLDASWHLPPAGRDPRAEYLAEHIPGALFFDIDDLVDDTSELPHMLASPTKFASRMKAMGIGDGLRLVVYDSTGVYSAARAWWSFRAMGHGDVSVLDGGLPRWKAEGLPVETGPARPRAKVHFTTRFNAALVADLDDVKGYVERGGCQLVDARPAARFRGEQAEPREGLLKGHMPGAANVPYGNLLNADGTLKSAADLAEAFGSGGVDLRQPIATTCGSGITACILALALARLGRSDVGVYDGSFAEWGRPETGLPVVTGE